MLSRSQTWLQTWFPICCRQVRAIWTCRDSSNLVDRFRPYSITLCCSRKSVSIWQSYSQNRVVPFFRTRCICVDITRSVLLTISCVVILIRLRITEVTRTYAITSASNMPRRVPYKWFLWPPYGIGQDIIFLPCGFFYLLSIFFFSSPNLNRCRLDVCPTSTRALVPCRCSLMVKPLGRHVQ